MSLKRHKTNFCVGKKLGAQPNAKHGKGKTAERPNQTGVKGKDVIAPDEHGGMNGWQQSFARGAGRCLCTSQPPWRRHRRATASLSFGETDKIGQ